MMRFLSVFFYLGIISFSCLSSLAFASDSIPETQGGLYFSKPHEENGKIYFSYRDGGTEESEIIRATINKKSNNQLLKDHSSHLKISETSKLSEDKCHEYALAKIFGYKEKPTWINILSSPRSFKCEKYFQMTCSPKIGDLVDYDGYHFGIMGPNGKVLSTWGSSSNSAYEHPPFFIPSMYGYKCAVWTPQEGKTFTSIRLEIEQNLIDQSLSQFSKEDEKEDAWMLVKKFQAPSISIDTLLSLIDETKRIPAERRQQVIEDTLELVDKCNIEDPWPLITSISQIPLKRRHEFRNALKSFIASKKFSILLGEDKGPLRKVVLSGECISHVISTINNIDPERTIPLSEATSLLIKRSSNGENISDILKAIDNCSQKFNLDPIVIAKVSYPFFVNNMGTSEVKYLLTQISTVIKNGQTHYIDAFIKSGEVNDEILSLGGSFIAFKLERFIQSYKRQ